MRSAFAQHVLAPPGFGTGTTEHATGKMLHEFCAEDSKAVNVELDRAAWHPENDDVDDIGSNFCRPSTVTRELETSSSALSMCPENDTEVVDRRGNEDTAALREHQPVHPSHVPIDGRAANAAAELDSRSGGLVQRDGSSSIAEPEDERDDSSLQQDKLNAESEKPTELAAGANEVAEDNATAAATSSQQPTGSGDSSTASMLAVDDADDIQEEEDEEEEVAAAAGGGGEEQTGEGRAAEKEEGDQCPVAKQKADMADQQQTSCSQQQSESTPPTQQLTSNSNTNHNSGAAGMELLQPNQRCPVCLVFQSSSNTALNAHIDHCLATSHRETHSKPKSQKSKVRKKRSMAELCLIAPPCVLDESEDERDDRTASLRAATPSSSSSSSHASAAAGAAPANSALTRRKRQKRRRFHKDQLSKTQIRQITIRHPTKERRARCSIVSPPSNETGKTSRKLRKLQVKRSKVSGSTQNSKLQRDENKDVPFRTEDLEAENVCENFDSRSPESLRGSRYVKNRNTTSVSEDEFNAKRATTLALSEQQQCFQKVIQDFHCNKGDQATAKSMLSKHGPPSLLSEMEKGMDTGCANFDTCIRHVQEPPNLCHSIPSILCHHELDSRSLQVAFTASTQKRPLFAEFMVERDLPASRGDQEQHHLKFMERLDESSLQRPDAHAITFNEKKRQAMGPLPRKKSFPFQIDHNSLEEELGQRNTLSFLHAQPFAGNRFESSSLPYSSLPSTEQGRLPLSASNLQRGKHVLLSDSCDFINEMPLPPTNQRRNQLQPLDSHEESFDLSRALVNYSKHPVKPQAGVSLSLWMSDANDWPGISQQTNLPRSFQQNMKTLVPMRILQSYPVFDSTDSYTTPKASVEPVSAITAAEMHGSQLQTAEILASQEVAHGATAMGMPSSSANHALQSKSRADKAQPARLPPWMQAALNDQRTVSFASLNMIPENHQSTRSTNSTSMQLTSAPTLLEVAGKSVLRLMGKTMVLAPEIDNNEDDIGRSQFKHHATSNYENIWKPRASQNHTYYQFVHQQNDNVVGPISPSACLENRVSQEHVVKDRCGWTWKASGTHPQPSIQNNARDDWMWEDSNSWGQLRTQDTYARASMANPCEGCTFGTKNVSFLTPNQEMHKSWSHSHFPQDVAPCISKYHAVGTPIPLKRTCHHCGHSATNGACKSRHCRQLANRELNYGRSPSCEYSTLLHPQLGTSSNMISSFASTASKGRMTKQPAEIVIIDDDDDLGSSDTLFQSPSVQKLPNTGPMLHSSQPDVMAINSLGKQSSTISFLSQITAEEACTQTLIPNYREACAGCRSSPDGSALRGYGQTEMTETDGNALLCPAMRHGCLSSTRRKVNFIDLVKQQERRKAENHDLILNSGKRINCSQQSFRNCKSARVHESGSPGDYGPRFNGVVPQGWRTSSSKSGSTAQAVRAPVEKMQLFESRNLFGSSSGGHAPSSVEMAYLRHKRNALGGCPTAAAVRPKSNDPPLLSSFSNHDTGAGGGHSFRPTKPGTSLGICSTNMNPAEMVCAACWSMRPHAFPFIMEESMAARDC